MTDLDRRSLSFRQAEGLDPVPGPLALGELSQEARSIIWAVIYRSLLQSAKRNYDKVPFAVGGSWPAILQDYWVLKRHKPLDEFSESFQSWVTELKTFIYRLDYAHVFDLLTLFLRHRTPPFEFEPKLAAAFEAGRLAYRVAERTIWPAASPEEGETIQRALSDLAATEFGGARSHLRSAGQLLTAGDWAGSIRESIHAVESVAVLIEPSAKTLSEALKRLLNAHRINPNLKTGLEKLYAYSSDEKGVRHALVFEEVASVDQADAVYMLGACAAFVSFLIARRP